MSVHGRSKLIFFDDARTNHSSHECLHAHLHTDTFFYESITIMNADEYDGSGHAHLALAELVVVLNE